MATAGEIDILVDAKTSKFSEKMDKVEQRAKKTAEVAQSPFEKLGSVAQKALDPIGAVGAAIQGVELLSKGATAAVDLFTALTAEGEEADEAMKRVEATIRGLPLGLGPAIGSIIDLGKAITGVAAAERELAEQQEKLAKAETFDKQIKGLEASLSLAKALTAEDRARIQIQQEFEKISAQAEEAATPEQRARVLEIADQQRTARLAALNKQLDEKRTQEQKKKAEEVAKVEADAKAKEDKKSEDRRKAFAEKVAGIREKADKASQDVLARVGDSLKVFGGQQIRVSGAGSSGVSTVSPATSELQQKSNDLLAKMNQTLEQQLRDQRDLVRA